LEQQAPDSELLQQWLPIAKGKYVEILRREKVEEKRQRKQLRAEIEKLERR